MPVIEKNSSERMCPLVRERCCDACHHCEFWDYIRGVDRNTGKEVDQWMCLFKQQRLLTLENSACVRDVAAETGALRNEIANQITQHTRHTAQAIGMAAQLVAQVPEVVTALPVREMNTISVDKLNAIANGTTKD